jgi:serine/alanine racemase
METKKAYTGIDIFRIIAAILVITNHTSPILDYTTSGNFILTGIFARLSVPFFFMTSGFFLIRDVERDNGRLWSFIKKSSLIYGAAILLCLPLQIYKGDFSVRPLLPSILKNLFFNGTLYHLWYLPASIIGGIIAWYLVRKFGYKIGFAVSAPLYLIGLLGNGYYGITRSVPFLKTVFGELFTVVDTTQNGIFFAPLFIILGAFIYSKKDKMPKRIPSLIGFLLALSAMIAEGLILRENNFQLHDSMYLLLPATSFFLFSFLVSFRGKRLRKARDISLIVYIIHPVIIVAIRFASALIGLEKLFIDNESVMFVTVTVLSFVASYLCVYIFGKLPKKAPVTMKQRSWIELDAKALMNNVNELRRVMPKGCKLLAIVKDEGYGHGAFEICRDLYKMGVDAYGVATIDEAIAIRKYGIKGLILVLGYTDPIRAKDIKKYRITQTVFDIDYARQLDAQGKKIKVHIGIDSGMHRIGIPVTEIDTIASVYSLKNLSVDGVFSHLCVSDSQKESDVDYTRKQIDAYSSLLSTLKEMKLPVKASHIQASYGLLNYPEIECSYARMGIALYGADSEPGCKNNVDISLSPVMAIRSKIIQLRTYGVGESIGYGRAFITERESKIAVLPIGYGDGIPRCLSGKASVLVCGKRAPMVGRICMDQLMIDVTDIDNVKIGDIVTLIGSDGNETITAEEVASQAGTITNEIFSRLGRRLDII